MTVQYDDGLNVDWSDTEMQRIRTIKNGSRSPKHPFKALFDHDKKCGYHNPLARLCREIWGG
jgi:hypothetical protein